MASLRECAYEFNELYELSPARFTFAYPTKGLTKPTKGWFDYAQPARPARRAAVSAAGAAESGCVSIAFAQNRNGGWRYGRHC